MIASIVGEIILGWLLADLVTGAFHWWEDQFGREDWPVIGKWLIVPNRLHHVDPLAFEAHGFLGRNTASVIAATLIGGAWCALVGPSAMLAAAMLGAGLANEVHYLAHRPSRGCAAIRVLQQMGALQSPKAHAAHHRPPQTSNFCVLTDWLNPALEAVGAWRRLERVFGGRP